MKTTRFNYPSLRVMNRGLSRLKTLRRFLQQKRCGHGGESVNPGPPITFDYVPVPFQPYQKVYNELNAQFNTYLAISGSMLVCSLALAFYTDIFSVEGAWRPPKSYRQRNSN